MAIYEKHLEMNTCVTWSSGVSNRICQTRMRLVIYIKVIYIKIIYRKVSTLSPVLALWWFDHKSKQVFSAWFPLLIPATAPNFGRQGFCFQTVFSFCIYFSLLFLLKAKTTWKIREKVPVRACQIPLPFCQMFYELSYLHNWINFHYKHNSHVYLGNTVVKNDSCIPYRTIPQ